MEKMHGKEILLLVDYRNQFYFSTKSRGGSVDLDNLEKYFKEKGFSLIVKKFSEIDFRNQNYKDKYVMFQSSEDPSLHYKDYIQDIILGLHLQGAILIPSIYFFRAHHNKVFMEIVRDIFCADEAGNIISNGYGSYEDYIHNVDKYYTGDYVIKPDAGTRSRNVRLMSNFSQKIKYPYEISRTFTFHNLRWAIAKFLFNKPYIPQSNNRKKFIVQNFIEGLDGDYRVIIYGEKYYVLYRKNRENDFRASGSGDIYFDIELPKGLLDYSRILYKKFNTPYVSLDIGHKNGTFYLFEFQFVCIGQYAIEKSKWYYSFNYEKWSKILEEPDLEREIVSAVVNHIVKM